MRMKKFSILIAGVLSLGGHAALAQPPMPCEPDGTVEGHEYVDFWLPSGNFWATCNLGAATPYDAGLLFQWGVVTAVPESDLPWQDYIYFEGFHDPEEEQYPIVADIGADISDTEYDAVRHMWGNGWRMPTEEDMRELLGYTTPFDRTEAEGVRGVRLLGHRHRKSIFIPAPENSTFYYGGYWTATEEGKYPDSEFPEEPSPKASAMVVCNDKTMSELDAMMESSRKCRGLYLRAVYNPYKSGVDAVGSERGCATLAYIDGCIRVRGGVSGGRISVHDLSGRLVYTGAVTDGVCRLQDVSRGMYLVSYMNEGGRTVSAQKIMVK